MMASVSGKEHDHAAGPGGTDQRHMLTQLGTIDEDDKHFLQALKFLPVAPTGGGQWMPAHTGTVVQHSGQGAINFLQHNATQVQGRHQAGPALAGLSMEAEAKARHLTHGM